MLKKGKSVSHGQLLLALCLLAAATATATGQGAEGLYVKRYSWSMNALYYPRTPGCDSVYARDYDEILYYNSDSLFYKMATQGRTLDVEDLLHHFYNQILEDHASREKIDAECRKMREAANRYKSSLLEDEADFMETYFMQAGNDSLWNIKDERMNELIRRAAKNKQYANECRLTFELFHSCLNHRQYDRAFKYAAILLEKMKNMTDADYFKRRETYFYIGSAYYFFRDYARAVECFRIAMQEGERLFFDRSGLRAKEAMALYYATVNQLDSSDYYYRVLYNSPEQVRFRPHYDFVAIQGLADNCIRRGEYDKALALLQKFHPEILKAKNAYSIAINTYRLGICYLEMGCLDRAKSMMDSTRIMLMKSKERLQIYPKKAKEIDFQFKEWYDLMSRYNKIIGNPELEHAYRDSVYLIDSAKREETNALIMLYAEQKLFETEKALKEKQITLQQSRIIFVTVIFLLSLLALAVLFTLYRKKQAAYHNLVLKSQQWAGIIAPEDEKNTQAAEAATTHSALPDTFDLSLMDEVERLIKEKKLYKNPLLTLDALAGEMNVKRNYLSNAINRCRQSNFNTYINEYRIKEAIRIISSNNREKVSVEELSFEAGFNSRSVFSRTFKKVTGLSPISFIKNA